MAERPEHLDAVDQPEPEQVLPDPPPPRADHELSDADDRTVELTEPDEPDPPVDDEDRDPGRSERRPPTP